MNERKLSNYTVVYGTYENVADANGVLHPESVVKLAHLKAPSMYDASQCAEGRFIAVFEGHITGLLG